MQRASCKGEISPQRALELQNYQMYRLAYICSQCDKTQPTCLRCEKLGKPCPGYDKKRKFVDEGVTLRKKYQRSGADDNAAASPVRKVSGS